MKKIFLSYLLAAAAVTSAAQGVTSGTSSVFSAIQDLVAQTPMSPHAPLERLIGELQAGQGESIYQRATPEVQQALTVTQLNQIWAQLEAQAGAFITTEDFHHSNKDKYDVIDCRVCFKNLSLRCTATFDAIGRIAGLLFAPDAVVKNDPAAEAEAATYMTEREVIIAHGKISLPGTLCLPKAKEAGKRFPLVVMVHGSGPNDRDETIGPNRPFREMAHALACRGIATLRYDKRTYVYGTKVNEVGGADNYDTEVVHDAVEALKLGGTLAEINPDQVFLLGHSLGAGLVPRIISQSQVPVAGGVMWCASARALDVVLHEQIHYIAPLQGLDAAAAEAMYAQMLATLPQAYLDFARAHRPLDEGRACASPLLVIGAGHDYQVTKTDYDLWREALPQGKGHQFLWIENADHCLRETTEMATPNSYMQYLPLNEKGVEGIANFVLKQCQK